ncbi:MAG: hypothetical protein JWM74_3882 [Myxococcaceae bacterium]|nr:hypothetical protein [Myxococcaceae bacterium]
MASPPSPCHLLVLLARQGDAAVIIRRGPAGWTRLITWNTRTDVFEAGQWFRGAFYERRCDLSPSGDKLIYFVAKHHLGKVDPSYTSAWTAISKPPYLTALGLWPNAGTTYHGGGLFDAEDVVSINSVDHRWSNPERDAAAHVHPKHTPPRGVRVRSIAFTSGDQLFAKRLARDGWTLVEGGPVDQDMAATSGRFVREVGDQKLELAFGYHQADYTLSEKKKGRWSKVPIDGMTWADWDRRGRFVFAKDGSLYALRRTQVADLHEVDMLASFNDQKPSRVMTPAHAKVWR